MKDLNIVFAGFGGQGVLFAGKVAAYAGLLENKEISWLPSYGPVEPGGTVLIDSSLIDKKVERTDVTVYYVPSSALAEENGLKGLSNMILIGKLFQEVCCAGGEYHFCTEETLDHAIQKCIPPKKANMLDFNRKAIAIGQKA